MGELLFLTGLNTYTGTTRILGGTLSIGDGGTTGSLDPSSQIVNNGSLIINRSDDLTFSNSISGTGTLTKSGAGKLLLPNNNTYSGNTTVNGGTLQIGSDNALGSGAILYLSGGAIEASGASRTITNQVNLTASSSVVGSQDVTFSNTFYQDYVNNTLGGVVLTNNLTAGKKLTINGTVPIKRQWDASTVGFGGTGDTVINGSITPGDQSSGNLGNLFKSGAGTLTFSSASANTYNGLTTVSGGTLALAKLNGVSGVQAIPAGGLTVGGANNTAATVQYAASTTNPDMMGTGVVTINGRGILDFNGATDTIGNVAIVSTGATGANPTPIINTAGGGNLTIGTLGITPVAGFTSVVNAGTGTITLGGDVTFNAATTGQAQITGTALSLGAANRNFIVGLGTGAGQDLLIDAQITGASRSLTKSGAGRLTLSNANNYSGGTTVSAGSLLLSGAFDMPTTGTLAVSNGGTFSLADGTARAANGATTGVGLTLATGSWLGFDWNGGSLDSFTTLGTATATGTVVININSTSPTGSGGTLITAAGGSTLNAATYLLANNTNYTATISSTPTTVSIGAQTPVTALTDAYWLGNQVAGFTGTMTVSTGPTSNWASDASGTPAGGVVPGGSAVNVIFGATGAAQQANVTTGLSDMNLGSITFNDSAAVTIAGAPNTITLNSTSATAASTLGALQTVTAGSAISVTQYSSTTNTISANLALGANQTWNVASGKTLAVSGIVTGTGSLTKAGAGTVTLSTNNTYTGTTTISAGTLTLSGTSASGGIAIDSGGTLQLGNGGATGSLSPSSAIVNNGNLTINRSDNVAQGTIFASTISGSGSLTKSGAGTLTLSGANTYTGATVLNGGTLSLGTATTLGNTTNIIFAGNTTVYMNDQNVTVTQTVINAGATATFYKGPGGGALVLTIGGPITGSGSFACYATGGSVGVTFSGGLANFTGVLQFGERASFTVPSLQDATANIRNASGSAASFIYNGVAPMVLNNRRFELASTGGLGLYNNAASAANTLTINNDLLVTAAGAKTLTLGGSNPGINTFAGRINDGPGAAIGLTVNGSIWSLPATNTFTGGAGIPSGTVIVSSLKDYGSPCSLGAGTAAINFGEYSNPATIIYTGAGDSCNRAFYHTTQIAGGTPYSTILNNGTGALTFTAAQFISSQYASGNGNARGLALGGTYSGGTNEIQGTIMNMLTPGATPLTKLADASIWMLSGSNTYSSGTTVGGGALILNYATQDNSKFADGAALTLSGGTVTLKDGTHTEVVLSTTLNTAGTFLTRSGSSTGKLRLNAIGRGVGSTISFADATIADTDTVTVNGILGGWATLGNDWATSAASGTDIAITALPGGSYTGTLPSTASAVTTANYTLTGSQSQSGAVSANTVKIANSGNSQTLTLGANNLTITALGGILYVGGNDNTYTISGSGTVGTSAGELIITTVSGTTLNMSAPIIGSGAGILTKTGAGTLVLNAASQYTGATYVNQGTLRLANATATGTTGGGIFVQNGAAVEFANGITVGAEAITVLGSGVANSGALSNTSGTNAYAGAIAVGTGGALIKSVSGLLTLGGAITTTLSNDLTFDGAGDVTVTNVISGAGRVIKNGTGTLTLTTNNTYSGATLINEGTLVGVVGGSCSNSAVTVASAGALGVSVTDNTKKWSCASLALNNGSQLKFNFTGTPSTTVAPLNILGSLTFSGTPTIVVSPSNTAPGTYPLLTVGGAAPTSVPTLTGVSYGRLAWIGNTLWLTIVPAPTIITFF
jgi:autotransporter-associated beta strand protein